jgi:hypothetical protein
LVAPLKSGHFSLLNAAKLFALSPWPKLSRIAPLP